MNSTQVSSGPIPIKAAALRLRISKAIETGRLKSIEKPSNQFTMNQSRKQDFPQGLKPADLAAPNGTAKASALPINHL